MILIGLTYLLIKCWHSEGRIIMQQKTTANVQNNSKLKM